MDLLCSHIRYNFKFYSHHHHSHQSPRPDATTDHRNLSFDFEWNTGAYNSTTYVTHELLMTKNSNKNETKSMECPLGDIVLYNVWQGERKFNQPCNILRQRTKLVYIY